MFCTGIIARHQYFVFHPLQAGFLCRICGIFGIFISTQFATSCLLPIIQRKINLKRPCPISEAHSKSVKIYRRSFQRSSTLRLRTFFVVSCRVMELLFETLSARAQTMLTSNVNEIFKSQNSTFFRFPSHSLLSL